MKKKSTAAVLLVAILLASGCSENKGQVSNAETELAALANDAGKASEVTTEIPEVKEAVWEPVSTLDFLSSLKEISDVKSYDFRSVAEIKNEEDASMTMKMGGTYVESGDMKFVFSLEGKGEDFPYDKPMEFDFIVKDKAIYLNAKAIFAISMMGGTDVSYLDGLSKEYVRIDASDMSEATASYGISGIEDVDEKTIEEAKVVIEKFFKELGDKFEAAIKDTKIVNTQRKENVYKFDIDKENIKSLLAALKDVLSNDLGEMIANATETITDEEVRTQIDEFITSYDENGKTSISEGFDEIIEKFDELDVFKIEGQSTISGEKGSKEWELLINSKVEYDAPVYQYDNIYYNSYDAYGDTDADENVNDTERSNEDISEGAGEEGMPAADIAPEVIGFVAPKEAVTEPETEHKTIDIDFSFTAKEISSYTTIDAPEALTMEEFQSEVEALVTAYYEQIYAEYYSSIETGDEGEIIPYTDEPMVEDTPAGGASA